MACEVLTGNIRMMIAAAAFKPDFVHANDVNTLVPGWVAARWASAHLIYDAHEISADREGYLGRIWLVKFVEKFFGGGASGRITTTRTRADWFIENYGYPDMGVVQNRPQYSEVKADRIRTAYQIPADKLIVLYQGGLQPGRGLHNIIEAVRAVPQVHLVFVGDGRQRASLEAASADLLDRVHFVGQVPLSELPEWTASADVGLQTLRNTCLNHYSTDSNKLFEYVMGGLAVVASDFPEIRTIVSEHDLGILVDPEDVPAISAAIRSYANDHSELERLRTNARNARAELDWRSQVPAFLSVYRQAVANG
jgi:glycosyltransferase involved in cell wall biosynthesis